MATVGFKGLKQNIALKHERIRITTAREEPFRMTALRPNFGTFHSESSAFRK